MNQNQVNKQEEQTKSLMEEFYEHEVDDGETFHITRHIVKAEQSYKTLDVKILELKEDPQNLDLLFDIIALVFQNIEDIKSGEMIIRDLDLVNYVLANALKADIIKTGQLGLVVYYLDTVNAPSIYYQYAILRICQNLVDCKLYDINLAM